MLKVLICVALVGAVMTAVGWLSFSNGENQASLTIEKQQVIEDTEKAKEKVKEFVGEFQSETPRPTAQEVVPAESPQTTEGLPVTELPTEVEPSDGAIIVPDANAIETNP